MVQRKGSLLWAECLLQAENALAPGEAHVAAPLSFLGEALAAALHHDIATHGSLARSGAWKEIQPIPGRAHIPVLGERL